MKNLLLSILLCASLCVVGCQTEEGNSTQQEENVSNEVETVGNDGKPLENPEPASTNSDSD